MKFLNKYNKQKAIVDEANQAIYEANENIKKAQERYR